MKLKEFLPELNDTADVVIIEKCSDREQDEETKFWFPDVSGYIHLCGLKSFAFKREGKEFTSEMRDEYKEIGDYEICDVDLITNRDDNPYIAITICK